MTTAELATQLMRDAILLRKAPLPLTESYAVSQRLEEAAARLDVLASLEKQYEEGRLR